MNSCFLKIASVILFLFICHYAYADAGVQRISLEPLTSVSISTVTTNTAVVTLPTVALRGRKEILIKNISSYNAYISTNSYNTATCGGVWELGAGAYIRINLAGSRDSITSYGTVIPINLFATSNTVNSAVGNEVAVLKVFEIK